MSEDGAAAVGAGGGPDGGPDGATVVLEAPGLVVRLDGSGAVVSVTPTAEPDVAWLVGAGALSVADDAGRVDLGAPTVAVDDDEVEVERTGDGLRTVVRHAVDRTWDVRLVLAEESGHARTLSDVRLGWAPAPGCVVTALAAGARATYAVRTADGRGPVLVGRLSSGTQCGVDEEGLLLGPVLLGAGHRRAVQWRWEVVPDARHVVAEGLPPATWLDLSQTVVLPAGPDVAVVAPGLTVEAEEDRVEVGTDEPGPYVVELRAARGTTTYALSWAPDLDDLVDAAAEAALAGPRTRAGTARLGTAVAALVVQDALRRRSVGPPDELAEALELAAGTFLDQLDQQLDQQPDEQLDEHPDGRVAEQPDGAPSVPAPDPLVLALLAREADRTGDAALLDAASAGLLAVRAPVRGVGLAGAALALARVRAGQAPAAELAHLTGLLALGAPGSEAGLELALLLRPRAAVGQDDDPAGDDEEPVRGLWRLGAGLGAGLPGRVVPAAALEQVAYASTLLGLVDEATGQRLRRGWGTSASELARRAAAEARARVAEAGPGTGGSRALAWLVLGRPPG